MHVYTLTLCMNNSSLGFSVVDTAKATFFAISIKEGTIHQSQHVGRISNTDLNLVQQPGLS